MSILKRSLHRVLSQGDSCIPVTLLGDDASKRGLTKSQSLI